MKKSIEEYLDKSTAIEIFIILAILFNITENDVVDHGDEILDQLIAEINYRV